MQRLVFPMLVCCDHPEGRVSSLIFYFSNRIDNALILFSLGNMTSPQIMNIGNYECFYCGMPPDNINECYQCFVIYNIK